MTQQHAKCHMSSLRKTPCTTSSPAADTPMQSALFGMGMFVRGDAESNKVGRSSPNMSVEGADAGSMGN